MTKMTGLTSVMWFSMLVVLLATGCEYGTLEVQFSGESSGGTTYPTTPSPGATESPSTSTNPTTNPELGGSPTQPEGPPPLLQHATFGERCIEGQTVRYLVLSNTTADCATDAARIDTAVTSENLVGAVAIPLDGAGGTTTVQYCATAGDCRDVPIELNLNDQGTAVSGSWSGAPDGTQRTIQFEAQNCAYDALVEPLPGETLATGISVDEVSVYQGVKIPVVEDGAMVNTRNAPIVAGRPGVVRVFVTPEADWQAREIIARLTVGDMVKEETMMPMQNSSETDGESTFNFAFADGELPANADFSIELLESQACADVPGELATPRLPEADTVPFQSTGLSAPMKITLVPIQYDADGSGRLPTLDAATVDRFKNEAFKHYPVPEIEITVRDAVSTSQGLAPNGGGFGEMLNLCLNVRANDNPAADTYYYCVIQPANTANEFCGSGCVAGVAPVPGANDVGSRGGIGISFGGDGEGVFVHELGHALGRPHSPCGGAAGTDPNYPYSQGRIGSWGYDIMTGRLFEPATRADFMGYCNPAWVSDYTYDKLFDRLSNVIGAQATLLQTEPRKWKTGVVRNGEVTWGDDLTLRRIPGGHRLPATLRDSDGREMGQPEVYTVEVADIDATLVRIEDPGVGGVTVDVPGLGELQLP